MNKRFVRAHRGRRPLVAGVVGALAALAVLVAGCSKGSGGSKAHPTTTIPAPTVTVTPAAAATGVALDTVPSVTVEHGRITKVVVAAPGGQPIGGQISPDGRTWKTLPGLVPNTKYSGTVTVVGDNHKTVDQPWSFTTGPPARELHTTFRNISNGGTYGVGMPIVIKLNTSIPSDKRAELAKRLTVTTSPPGVVGAWRWISGTELHWRPRSYWPAHTKVTLGINFKDFDAGGGTWGVDSANVSFQIGDAHISVVDAASHIMVVTNNGQQVKGFPVSTGRDKYPTKSGVHVVNERAQKVTMDSATVGIPRDSPDGYFEDVFWNVRISNSGEFVHAAPWSVADQGRSNVSHGCVNLAPPDAEWFFNFSRVGDVVEVRNTPDPLQSWNGYGDWQIPWAQWAA